MIGSANPGATPPDSSGGSPAFYELGLATGASLRELTDVVVAFGQALCDALAPAVIALGQAFGALHDGLVAGFGTLAAFMRAVWDEAACIDFAVTEMGVARSDVRAVVFAGHRRCPAPHVWLWNHRRIPFPPGSGPALTWGSS